MKFGILFHLVPMGQLARLCVRTCAGTTADVDGRSRSNQVSSCSSRMDLSKRGSGRSTCSFASDLVVQLYSLMCVFEAVGNWRSTHRNDSCKITLPQAWLAVSHCINPARARTASGPGPGAPRLGGNNYGGILLPLGSLLDVHQETSMWS